MRTGNQDFKFPTWKSRLPGHDKAFPMHPRPYKNSSLPFSDFDQVRSCIFCLQLLFSSAVEKKLENILQSTKACILNVHVGFHGLVS